MSNLPTNQTPIDAIEPEIANLLVSRRSAIIKGASVSSVAFAGLRMASVPVALAALSRETFGQGRLPAVVIGVLNFALTLEYLESAFYTTGVNTAGLIPAADRPIFDTITMHEAGHVQFLKSTLGRSARPSPAFDFTAGNGSGSGIYADVFSNYATFKAVAQAFEDTGVRAYKGQAPSLKPYGDVLTAALTIHSVEGRHASEIRRLRGDFMDTQPFYQGWITGNETDVPGAGAVYAGEQNLTHLGVDISTLPALSGVSNSSLTEAFDEPLTMGQVLAIVDPFIV